MRLNENNLRGLEGTFTDSSCRRRLPR